MRLKHLLPALASLLWFVASANVARAYPAFQLSSGADTCQQCHSAVSGGGLLNDYGRDEAGSLAQGGDGRLLHGAWTPPSWLELGGDFRVAGGVRQPRIGDSSEDVANEPETLLFPMQGDLYAAVHPTTRFSVFVTAGLRATARESEESVVDKFTSREHYVQWRDQERGWYVRAGRFYPIFGLRGQDHSAYTRRFGEQYLFEEPYAVGVGRFAARDEWHLHAYGPQPWSRLGVAPEAFGLVGYYERRDENSTRAWGAQSRLSRYQDDRTRAVFGGVYKWWLPSADLLLLGELNFGVERFSTADASRAQVSSQAAAYWFMARGWISGAAWHLWDDDLVLRRSTRQAADLSLQWLPRAHLELHLLGRVQSETLTDNPDALALLQLHYFL